MSGLPRRVVDAHHHLWDLANMRYPWLQDGPPVSEDRSGLAPIRRDYLAADFLRDFGDIPVLASVHVEAAHDPSVPVAETRWLDEVAREAGYPHALVAFARLDDPALDALLDSHATSPRLRGVRQMANWEPQERIAERGDLLDDPAWLVGLDVLAQRGLSFDLQVFPSQLRRAAEVVAENPDVLFVIDHGGYLQAATGDRDRVWRAGIRALADAPNVAVKASSYASVDPSLEVAGLRAWLEALAETFGPERMLWGSNFPVDGRFVTYREQVEAYAAAVAGWSDRDRDAFWFSNAVRVYRLEVDEHPAAGGA